MQNGCRLLRTARILHLGHHLLRQRTTRWEHRQSLSLGWRRETPPQQESKVTKALVKISGLLIDAAQILHKCQSERRLLQLLEQPRAKRKLCLFLSFRHLTDQQHTYLDKPSVALLSCSKRSFSSAKFEPNRNCCCCCSSCCCWIVFRLSTSRLLVRNTNNICTTLCRREKATWAEMLVCQSNFTRENKQYVFQSKKNLQNTTKSVLFQDTFRVFMSTSSKLIKVIENRCMNLNVFETM